MLKDFFELFAKLPNFENYLYAGILILPRFLGLALTAPVLSRKDIPVIIKISFAFMMTISFLYMFKDVRPPADTSFVLSIILNLAFGAMIGFVASVIFEAISAAGEMMNMQMGLQSAMMFDPNVGSQTSIMGRFFMNLGTVIFIQIGGLFWIFLAFQKGFDIFPLYGTAIPLQQTINMGYLIHLTGNIMFVGLQMASPIIITTLCQDIILGIISKIAPQINVFQLSFLFKPLIGSAIMIIILPLMVNTIIDYFHAAKIF